MKKGIPYTIHTATSGNNNAWWELHLLHLYTAFFVEEGKMPPKKIEAFVESESLIRFLLCPARSRSIPVGMATVSMRSDGTGTRSIGMVEDVFVLPEHRGKDYSTMLVGMVVDHARRRGLVRLDLTSAPHKPGRAIAMRVYEKFGFLPIALANPAAGKDATNFYRLEL